MSRERTTHLLVGVLLAVVLLSVSSVAVAGAPAAELGQTRNETAANGTTNDSTANATVGNLTTWVGSMDRFTNLTSPLAVRDAMHDGRLQRNDTVARNGTLVIEIPSARLTSALTATNGTDSGAAALLGLVNRSSVYHFGMVQTEDTTPAMLDEKELNLSATLAADAIRVLPDDWNGTLYLALRLDRVVLDHGSASDSAVGADEAYNVTVTVENATATTEVAAIRRPPITFDTDAGSVVRLSPGGHCSLVTGRTYPGADVSLEADVVSPESAPPEAETTVKGTRNGRFAACVNMTGIPSNATLRLSAYGFRGTVRGVAGHGGDGLLSITLADQNATNGTVHVGATLSDPGFVALYRVPSADALTSANESDPCFPPVFGPILDRPTAESRLVGVSDHLGPGEADVPVELTTDLNRSTVLVALVHPDRDDDGRFDYPGADFPPCYDRRPVSDSATISPVTTSSTGTDTDTEETVRAQSMTPSPPTTSNVDGPGFGPVAATLALLAVTLLARRRS